MPVNADILKSPFRLPPAQAIQFFRGKGFQVTEHWYDMWHDAHNRAFTVAGVARMDLLEDIRDLVDKSIAEGISFGEFKTSFRDTLSRLGWSGDPTLKTPRRISTIFRANSQSAYMAGRYQQQMEAAEFAPWWEYTAVLDAQTRPSHRALDGQVWRYDDPIWDTLYPPNGWGCRCRVIARTDRQVARMGITPTVTGQGINDIIEKEVTVGKDDPRTVKVKGYRTLTGDGQPITVWADPGWDYNPGKTAFKPDLKRYSAPVKRRYKRRAKAAPKKPRTSQYMPEGFAQTFGDETLPVTFWDTLKSNVKLVINSRAKKTYYLPLPRGLDYVQIGLRRTKKDLNVRRFIVTHEYGHAFYHHVVKNNDKLLSKARAIFRDAQTELMALPAKLRAQFKGAAMRGFYNDTIKELPESYSVAERKEMVLAFLDTVAALTGASLGHGHSRSYFRRPNMPMHEFFAHMTEIKFRGNPAIKKHMPKTAAAMRKFWDDALELPEGQEFAQALRRLWDD